MISTRPYLIRAIYDWILDNGFTPYILVDAEADDTLVPNGYAKDGKIIFNISSSATKNLTLSNETVSFVGRFNGVPTSVSVPTSTVLAVYAKETGAGMAFQQESSEEEEGELPEKEAIKEEMEESLAAPVSNKPSRPVLRIVK
uniref:Stringent starvation protein B n=1 Tax=Candidatus Kentrum sp. MB TaxID=2138164 RepID=A0A450XDI4_9GAMM|nr:MAG: stringent starvation protein B [Candidatus Kentron sp. MB]VFK33593.1 MAG: stringent starvation protein B [Candidatus Kentron sp. MB]VFK76272.1 MAG: stringent starvation protein B [Candidatus Kentron sp. MB]